MSETIQTRPAPPGGPPIDTPTLVSDSPPRRPHPLPLSLPDYEILDEIGRGGMGVVYKARQRNLNRLVALKVILAGPYASDLDKSRFKLEAEAAARLRHPNIVQVHDVGEHAGFAYIAFELVEGTTLRQYQDGHPLDPRAAAHIAAAVARAVHHAHENGIVHRDLKPGNILLASGGRKPPVSLSHDSTGGLRPSLAHVPKVTDFGLAKELAVDSGLTITGMACGTPNYMSPEQVRGTRDGVGPRTDVYGLGAILFELLTGAAPFAGVEPARIMEQILNAAPPSVRRVRRDAPRDLDVVVAKCLEKDPARRYHSAADLADDLERFLAGRAVRARAVGPVERGWRWCRRNPWAAAVLVVTSVGFASTGVLAARLARSAGVERAAHAEADAQRDEAERARDQLRDALADARTERTRADELRVAADTQAGLAKTEQKRAEQNARLARSVLRTAMDELRNLPSFKHPASRELRAALLRSTRGYVAQIDAGKVTDPTELEELSKLAVWVAWMEYLNGNMPAAAAEYHAAADLGRRWAAADPDDPAAWSRLADGLTNAGRAEFAAGDGVKGEADLREAVRVLDGMLAKKPKQDFVHAQAVHAIAPLVSRLVEAGRLPEAIEFDRRAVAVCHDRVARFGPSPVAAAFQAEAHYTLAANLARANHKAEAECHLLEAAALFDAAPPGASFNTPNRYPAADARLLLADLQLARGNADAAHQTYHTAAAAARAAGGGPAEQVNLARVEAAHAEALRRGGQLKPAEALFDRAIRQSAALLRAPDEGRRAREVWAQASAGRAHLYNTTRRHKEAAAEWAKLAKDDPDPDARLRHAMFTQQTLIFAGDWRGAAAGAAALDKGEQPGWYWMDMARLWCRLAAAAAADAELTPRERESQSDAFTAKAVRSLERAKAQDFFKSERMAKMVETEPDYAAVRGRFTPRE